MSEHDRMCRRAKIMESLMEGCPECALIARVRVDERKAARDAVAAMPYGTGTFWPKGMWLDRDEVLAAIDGVKP